MSRRRPITRRLYGVVVAGLLLLIAVAGVRLYNGFWQTTQDVRGVLIELQASSLVYADSAILRADDGTEYSFRVDPQVSSNREQPQSAGHLRQHMVFGEPMIVRYLTDADGTLVAVRMFDAT